MHLRVHLHPVAHRAFPCEAAHTCCMHARCCVHARACSSSSQLCAAPSEAASSRTTRCAKGSRGTLRLSARALQLLEPTNQDVLRLSRSTNCSSSHTLGTRAATCAHFVCAPDLGADAATCTILPRRASLSEAAASRASNQRSCRLLACVLRRCSPGLGCFANCPCFCGIQSLSCSQF